MTNSKFTGTFMQVIHGPKGGLEGMLLETDGQTVQFVLAKHDEAGATLVSSIQPGRSVTVAGDAMPPSLKGEGVHPVHSLDKIVAIDGKTPKKATAAASGYSGTIVRLNYARHGVPNGTVEISSTSSPKASQNSD
jgi:hypothetical protein